MSSGAPRPPRLGIWLLDRAVPPGPAREGLQGDLIEMHARRWAEQGRVRAAAWFLREAVWAALRYRAAAKRGDGASGPPATTRAGGAVRGWPRDLRLAARRLARSPAWAATAVLTLGLGFGATMSVFAAVHAVLLRPLPYPEPERLVLVEHELPGLPYESGGHPVFAGHWAQYLHYREHATQLESIGGYAVFDGALTNDGSPAEVYPHVWASPELLAVLGARPALGRLLRADDPRPEVEGRGTLLLTTELWRSRYGADPAVVGRQVRIEGSEYRVVGVLPAGFRAPGDGYGPLWTAATDEQLGRNIGGSPERIVARLAPGATPRSAAEELNRLLQGVPGAYPHRAVTRLVEEGRMVARVTPLQEALVGDLAGSFWLLLLASAVLTAIALTNVATLVLVRAEARARESATRIALGAGRADLVRHFLADSMLVVALGLGLGMAMARWGTAAVVRLVPGGLPGTAGVEPGPETWAVGALLGLLALIAFALIPWARGLREPLAALRRARGGTAGGGSLRLRKAMVVSQVALATVLLVGSGLLARSLIALHRVDPGFDAEGVLTFRVMMPFREVREAAGSRQVALPVFRDILARLQALPGVESVGMTGCLPLSSTCELEGTAVRPLDRPADAYEQLPVVGLRPVSPGYLEALGVPLLRGRRPAWADLDDRTNAVVVNQELVDRLWPGGGDPVGRRLDASALAARDSILPFTVVGVVGNVATDALGDVMSPIAYRPLMLREQNLEPWRPVFAVRTRTSPLGLADAVRREVAAVRPDLPVTDVQTLESVVARSTARLRFALALSAAGSLAALLLSAVGVYGVVAYVVGLRRGEFGIRLALGAEPPDLRSMVLREGAWTLLLGLTAGLGLALLGSRLLAAFVFGVATTDPATYGGVAAFLALTVLLATWLPALRASTVVPVEALRAE